MRCPVGFVKLIRLWGFPGGMSAVDIAMAKAAAPSYRFVAYTQDNRNPGLEISLPLDERLAGHGRPH